MYFLLLFSLMNFFLNLVIFIIIIIDFFSIYKINILLENFL